MSRSQSGWLRSVGVAIGATVRRPRSWLEESHPPTVLAIAALFIRFRVGSITSSRSKLGMLQLVNDRASLDVFRGGSSRGLGLRWPGKVRSPRRTSFLVVPKTCHKMRAEIVTLQRGPIDLLITSIQSIATSRVTAPVRSASFLPIAIRLTCSIIGFRHADRVGFWVLSPAIDPLR
jgi:hypothetical protein